MALSCSMAALEQESTSAQQRFPSCWDLSPASSQLNMWPFRQYRKYWKTWLMTHQRQRSYSQEKGHHLHWMYSMESTVHVIPLSAGKHRLPERPLRLAAIASSPRVTSSMASKPASATPAHPQGQSPKMEAPPPVDHPDTLLCCRSIPLCKIAANPQPGIACGRALNQKETVNPTCQTNSIPRTLKDMADVQDFHPSTTGLCETKSKVQSLLV